ncbi:hypothetical protein RRF57_010792 [Xylaria bambusicola]|uniref:Uncharacterized protein n=1 Tax=Xylaria bambusicola TaxID=326684 RepID=A0AAN7ULR7_9PEZI
MSQGQTTKDFKPHIRISPVFCPRSRQCARNRLIDEHRRGDGNIHSTQVCPQFVHIGTYLGYERRHHGDEGARAEPVERCEGDASSFPGRTYPDA